MVASSAVSSNMMNKTVIFVGGLRGLGLKERDLYRKRERLGEMEEET